MARYSVSEIGGAVATDARGRVRCYDQCEPTTAEACENTRADSARQLSALRVHPEGRIWVEGRTLRCWLIAAALKLGPDDHLGTLSG